MTFGAKRRTAYIEYDHRRLPPNALPQRVLGGGAAVFVAALCAWTVCDFVGPAADRADAALGVDGGRGDRLAMVSRRGDKLAVAKPDSPWSYYALLFDPRPASPATAIFVDASFTDDGSLQSNIRPVALTSSEPLPTNPVTALAPLRSDRAVKSAAALAPRSSAAPTRTAAARVAAAAQESAQQRPGFFKGIFEKLFGKPAPTTLAYAATDDAGLSATNGSIGGRYDRYTAVYDISAHTVYMPDGTRLEAHSGLGNRLDDPSHADERMHGVTPPNIYNLELREAPFHGVRALRMIPEDESRTFGRSGILAHTYMLGPNGDSNGCVSFKNYDAFLQAYLNHEIKRLAVVARLD